MSPMEIVVAVVIAALGGGGVTAIVVKYMSRSVDDATAAKVRAEAESTAKRAASSEVDILRKIIAEVRDAEARKSQRIDALEKRLDKLEERERHMLTRAAVHEGWVQAAYATLVAQNPQYPPPPPPLVIEPETENAADQS